MRSILVLLHRYIGLATAIFLALAGLTGSVLAFHHELDEWLNPQFYQTDHAATARMDGPSLIERLEAKGAFFRSLTDPIDTTSPQGKFTLQVLGAAAELERALIRERTKAGLRAARAQGRVGGNPALKAGDREAIRKLRVARDETYFQKLEATADTWLPLVRRHRPGMAWDDLTRLLGSRTGHPWTVERLKRAARRYVRDGLLPAAVLDRAPRRTADDRLLAIIAGMRHADPDLTLAGIAKRLEDMRERTPLGSAKWYPSSVRALLLRAEKMGLIAAQPTLPLSERPG